MRRDADLCPGGTYILGDFTIVQVVALAGDDVRYRVRALSWKGRRRVVVRRTRLSRLKGRVRAEVNGEFFPDVAAPGTHNFQRRPVEAAALETYLTEHAAQRPFARHP